MDLCLNVTVGEADETKTVVEVETADILPEQAPQLNESKQGRTADADLPVKFQIRKCSL